MLIFPTNQETVLQARSDLVNMMSVQDKGGKAQSVPKLLPHPARKMASPIFFLSFWECSLLLSESCPCTAWNTLVTTSRTCTYTQTRKGTYKQLSHSATARVHTLAIAGRWIPIPGLSWGTGRKRVPVRVT